LAPTAALLITLAACGDDGDPPPAPAIDTPAYVVTKCTENATVASGRQALKIRQRNGGR
jgi:hypothetical protein